MNYQPAELAYMIVVILYFPESFQEVGNKHQAYGLVVSKVYSNGKEWNFNLRQECCIYTNGLKQQTIPYIITWPIATSQL